jgi:hypothetical protein
MANHDDEDFTDSEIRRLDEKLGSNARVIKALMYHRGELGSVSSFLRATFRLKVDLTSKKVTQRIKRKQVPALRRSLADLMELVDQFEKALDERIEALSKRRSRS